MTSFNDVTFRLHTDPGHSWLEVDQSFIDGLGLTAAISGYSYIYRPAGDVRMMGLATAYLEEDCDMPLFLCHYHQKHGVWPQLDERRYDRPNDPECFIRRLERYPYTGGRRDGDFLMQWVSNYFRDHGSAAA